VSDQIFSGLNPEQQDAVSATDGPLLVLAGPGSGKTRVITHRISHLIGEMSIDSQNILAVTFTNRAANEIKERINNMVMSRDAFNLRCGTFHSFCVYILRQHGKFIGLNQNFVIYDDSEQLQVITESMKELQIDNKRFPPRSLLASISKHKSNLLTYEILSGTSQNFYDEIVSRVYESYQRTLNANSALDFDDLLMKAVQLLQNSKEIQEYYSNKYEHLMIDEFQDTNTAQYNLMKLLGNKYENICVVGDPNQSIYSWRNADIRNILSFQKDYPNAKVIHLSQNYRSTQNILDAASKLISSNDTNMINKLWTNNGVGESLIVDEGYSEKEEAEKIIHEIERLVKIKKYKWDECAIMYRVNAQSRVIEEACLSNKIPYKIVGGIKFYSRKEIKDVISYLKVIANSDDDISIARIINVPPRGIGATSYNKLVDFAKKNNKTIYKTLCTFNNAEELQELIGLTRRAAIAIEVFVTLLKKLIAESVDTKPSEIIQKIITDVGYQTYLQQDETNGLDRLENVMELKGLALQLHETEEITSMTDYLDRIALVSDVDSLDSNENSITLITLHQSKGLEFPVVFIAGMEEGLLPHIRSMEDPVQLEEERRLCYVGITRAEKLLYLLRTYKRYGFGQGSQTSIPSRFLSDISDLSIQSLEKNNSHSRNDITNLKSNINTSEKCIQLLDPIEIGTKVIHKTFGEGIVLLCTESGNDFVVDVHFNSAGKKKLLMSLANLQMIKKTK
tara:strand:+ start:2961 stop:5165 length:2205 start_codon:yes stop_codon:yes gene_type:complete